MFDDKMKSIKASEEKIKKEKAKIRKQKRELRKKENLAIGEKMRKTFGFKSFEDFESWLSSVTADDQQLDKPKNNIEKVEQPSTFSSDIVREEVLQLRSFSQEKEGNREPRSFTDYSHKQW